MALIFCTKCGHRVSTTAPRCPGCGDSRYQEPTAQTARRASDVSTEALTTRPPSSESQSPSSAVNSRDSKVCPSCGEMILVAATKCRFCGEFLNAVSDLSAPRTDIRQPRPVRDSYEVTEPPRSEPRMPAGELKESGTVTALSVIGLVFGLIGMLGSFVPCFGALAFYVSVPAAIASGLALGVAYSQQAKRTFAIVALSISLIGVVISGLQIMTISGAADAARRAAEQNQNQPR
jgi:predicted RNA-binding Zn-ribbon protein involved in translation (DUF1610 family)